LSDEFVVCLIVALSCSSSQSTRARLIGDVRVSVLYILDPIFSARNGPADTPPHSFIHH
jgi:hypothetical protein